MNKNLDFFFMPLHQYGVLQVMVRELAVAVRRKRTPVKDFSYFQAFKITYKKEALQ